MAGFGRKLKHYALGSAAVLAFVAATRIGGAKVTVPLTGATMGGLGAYAAVRRRNKGELTPLQRGFIGGAATGGAVFPFAGVVGGAVGLAGTGRITRWYNGIAQRIREEKAKDAGKPPVGEERSGVSALSGRRRKPPEGENRPRE